MVFAFQFQDVLYILAGALTGILSGVLGIGGGIIVVPALLFIFEMEPGIPDAISMHMAAGSSLAVMLFTSFAAVLAHYRLEPILWWVYQRLWLGIVLGTVFGVLMATQLPTGWLRILFAFFLLFIAYKMVMHKESIVQKEVSFPSDWVGRLVTFFIGVQSGLLGIGGSVLIIPYLTYCGIEPRRIVPVSSLCTLTVAWIGTATFILSRNEAVTTHYATGYIYWPAVMWVALSSMLFAPLGAKLSYQLPIQLTRYLFVGILLVTSVGLFL
ncbi:MAG: sulfite exporter TauE/SafE family protein [Gammaproteobacteria bacterium]|nr:sulfite exporter TauE/SafE family protein [Gammaproteobacteria bacterium]